VRNPLGRHWPDTAAIKGNGGLGPPGIHRLATGRRGANLVRYLALLEGILCVSVSSPAGRIERLFASHNLGEKDHVGQNLAQKNHCLPRLRRIKQAQVKMCFCDRVMLLLTPVLPPRSGLLPPFTAAPARRMILPYFCQR
jgi:hypothetical protein